MYHYDREWWTGGKLKVRYSDVYSAEWSDAGSGIFRTGDLDGLPIHFRKGDFLCSVTSNIDSTCQFHEATSVVNQCNATGRSRTSVHYKGAGVILLKLPVQIIPCVIVSFCRPDSSPVHDFCASATPHSLHASTPISTPGSSDKSEELSNACAGQRYCRTARILVVLTTADMAPVHRARVLEDCAAAAAAADSVAAGACAYALHCN